MTAIPVIVNNIASIIYLLKIIFPIESNVHVPIIKPMNFQVKSVRPNWRDLHPIKTIVSCHDTIISRHATDIYITF